MVWTATTIQLALTTAKTSWNKRCFGTCTKSRGLKVFLWLNTSNTARWTSRVCATCLISPKLTTRQVALLLMVWFLSFYQPSLNYIITLFSQALEEEEKMTPEQLAVKNVGRQDPKRHLEEEVDVLMTSNIVQCLGAMLSTVAFR